MELWALIRAWLGGAVALLAIGGAGAVAPIAVVSLAATVAYSASLILFLTGTPTSKTIWLGWAAFAAAIFFYAVFFVLLAVAIAAGR